MSTDKQLTTELRTAVDKYNRSRTKETKRKVFFNEVSPLDKQRDQLRNG